MGGTGEGKEITRLRRLKVRKEAAIGKRKVKNEKKLSVRGGSFMKLRRK